MVQDLIKQIVDKTGVPADKAQQVLGVVAGFVKEKFPMMGGQIDSLLGTGGGQAGGGDNNTGGNNLMGDIGGKMGF
jgi:hypothetical protein